MSLIQRMVAASALLVSASAQAFSFGVGVEGGGTLTYLTSTRVVPDFGLILTQRFDLGAVDLALWEDANIPVEYDINWAFIPIDIGLRVGLSGSIFRPYIGVLVNDSVPLPGSKMPSCGCGGPAVGNVPGLGGDLGFDLAAGFLRFGLELRAYETLIPPVSGGNFGDGFALQALLSVRAEF